MNEWDSGLEMLSACSDPKLRALAKLDRSRPADTPSLLQLADGWDALAKSYRGLAHENLKARSLEYYIRALPTATGLGKVRADREIRASQSLQRPSAPGIFVCLPSGKGLDLGLIDRNVGPQFLIQLEIKTTGALEAIVLSKRGTSSDGCLTLYLQSDGHAAVAADADFYRVNLVGEAVVNDGEWHTLTVEKLGVVVRLMAERMGTRKPRRRDSTPLDSGVELIVMPSPPHILPPAKERD